MYIKCDICGSVLVVPGVLLFSPMDSSSKTCKMHICVKCYVTLLKQIEELQKKLSESEVSDTESIAMYHRARDDRDALRARIAELEAASWIMPKGGTTYCVRCERSPEQGHATDCPFASQENK